MVEKARRQKSGALALFPELSLVVEFQGQVLFGLRHGGGCRRLRRTAGRPAQHVGDCDKRLPLCTTQAHSAQSLCYVSIQRALVHNDRSSFKHRLLIIEGKILFLSLLCDNLLDECMMYVLPRVAKVQAWTAS